MICISWNTAIESIVRKGIYSNFTNVMQSLSVRIWKNNTTNSSIYARKESPQHIKSMS